MKGAAVDDNRHGLTDAERARLFEPSPYETSPADEDNADNREEQAED